MSDNLMIANSHPPEEWSGITFNTGPGRVVIRITSDGKLEKAEGYSDEEAAQVMFDAVSDHIDGIWKKVRDENAALRSALTTLLAWEDKGGDIPPTAARGLFRIARAALDSARKEAQS